MAENEVQGEWALPSKWVWTSFDQVVDNFDSVRIPVRAADRAEMQGKYPYYGASGIIDHVNDYLFDGSFLLIAEDGANLLSRNTPIAFQAHGKFWVNNHAHVVRTLAGCPLGYLEAFFNATDLSPYVTGTAQPKLTQRNLNKIPVPLAPLPEQRRIVAEIETQFTRLDAGVTALERAQANLKRYRASVLKAACEGRLVPQDPADEPADQLLARILAASSPPRPSWPAPMAAPTSPPTTCWPASWPSGVPGGTRSIPARSTRSLLRRMRRTCRSCQQDGHGRDSNSLHGIQGTARLRSAHTMLQVRQFYAFPTFQMDTLTSVMSNSEPDPTNLNE